MAINKNPDDTPISPNSGGDSKMGSPNGSNDPASNECLPPLATLHAGPSQAQLETHGPSSSSVGRSNRRRRWRKLPLDAERARRWQEEERETALLGRRDHRQPDLRVAGDSWNGGSEATDQASKESIPLSPLDAAIPSEAEVGGAATVVKGGVALFDNVRVLPPLASRSPSLNQVGMLQSLGTGGLTSSRPGETATVRSPQNYRALQASAPAPHPAPVAAAVAEKPQPADVKLSTTELRRKTNSLLQEYFSRRDLKEALACVEKLKSPSCHSELVKHAVSLGLENIPPLVELVAKLVEDLFKSGIVSHEDMFDGLLGFAALLDDVGIKLPKEAPTHFGEILRRLVFSRALASEPFFKILSSSPVTKSVIAGISLNLLLPPPRNTGQMIVMQIKLVVKKLYKMALLRTVNFPTGWPKMMPKIQKEWALKVCVKKLLKIANRYELQGLYQDYDALEDLQNLWLDQDEELNRKPD